MTLPIVDWLGVSGTFHWEQEQITAEVSRPYDHRDTTSYEVLFRTASNGTAGKHLHQTRLNLLSSRSKSELANLMAKSFTLNPSPDWKSIVEALSVLTLRRLREGEAVEEIWTTDDIPQPTYLIHPLVAKNRPTIIFGPGGSGKSEIALVLGMAAQLPWTDNALKLGVSSDLHNVLYLDYETEKDEIAWRAKLLRNGLGLPHMSIKYLRGTAPLVACIEQIQRKIIDSDIKFLIIDSLAPACGAQDLNPSTGATSFFEALRTLKTTSLVLAHSSKPTPETKEATVYGSVFFTNLARSVWECRSVQQEGDNTLDVGLFHKKVNMSGKFEPLCFKITFDRDSTGVRVQDITDVPELEEGLPLPKRIQNILKKLGRASLTQIEERLAVDKKKLSPALSKLAKRNIVGNELGAWYLLDNYHIASK